MKAQKQPQISRTIPFLIMVCLLGLPAHAQYGGGTGEPNDPYLIYTPEHLQAVGLDPNSWDKHFRLMSDLDMIAYQGASESEIVRPIGVYSQPAFSGHFDGGGHTISHLTIGETGLGPTGLFGYVRPPLPSGFAWEAEAVEVIRDLGLIDPNVQSPSNLGVGALVGYLNHGKVSSCYVKGGIVQGANRAGGLVGSAPSHNIPNPHALHNCYVQDCDVQGVSLVGGLVGEFGDGVIDACWSVARVRGHGSVGGLAGMVDTFWQGHGLSMCWSSGTVEGASETGGLVGTCAGHGSMGGCYSTAAVQGGSATGGLVGANTYSTIANCYAIAPTAGVSQVGGLVGANHGTVTACYAAGQVTGQSQAGGLIGSLTADEFYPEGSVSDSFWDTDASGQTASAGGTGKTTTEMQTAATFLEAGWDFVGETANGNEDIWRILEGYDYPRLWWERLLGDDFEDGEARPLWFVYAPEPDLVQIREVNGRLETVASAEAQDVDAFYVSDGWRLDVTKEFAIRVDFHFSKQDGGDGRVTLGVVPSLDPSAMQWAELEAGCFDTGPFYLYEVSDGFWVQERITDRPSDGGALYMSYDPDTDELYFSYAGYGEAHAWQTLTGLLQGRWAGEPVYVILGGGSEGMALTGEDAWLDDFVVSTGTLILSEPDDDSGPED